MLHEREENNQKDQLSANNTGLFCNSKLIPRISLTCFSFSASLGRYEYIYINMYHVGMREHYVCDTEVNLCYSNPCLNGGTCLRKEGGYTCQCRTGFAGQECQMELIKSSRDPKSSSNCTSSQHYTPGLCQLRSRSFYRGSFLTFPALRQRYRLHFKLR